ncbi:3-dehydroquinate dehydratase [Spizellomyces sp. 'palustris']|nr:3-dehydroquinate dehydratase [Spizellomyces sp. 'palustris']
MSPSAKAPVKKMHASIALRTNIPRIHVAIGPCLEAYRSASKTTTSADSIRELASVCRANVKVTRHRTETHLVRQLVEIFDHEKPDLIILNPGILARGSVVLKGVLRELHAQAAECKQTVNIQEVIPKVLDPSDLTSLCPAGSIQNLGDASYSLAITEFCRQFHEAQAKAALAHANVLGSDLVHDKNPKLATVPANKATGSSTTELQSQPKLYSRNRAVQAAVIAKSIRLDGYPMVDEEEEEILQRNADAFAKSALLGEGDNGDGEQLASSSLFSTSERRRKEMTEGNDRTTTSSSQHPTAKEQREQRGAKDSAPSSSNRVTPKQPVKEESKGGDVSRSSAEEFTLKRERKGRERISEQVAQDSIPQEEAPINDAVPPRPPRRSITVLAQSTPSLPTFERREVTTNGPQTNDQSPSARSYLNLFEQQYFGELIDKLERATPTKDS